MTTSKTLLGALALSATAVASFATGRSMTQEIPSNKPGKQHQWLGSLTGEYDSEVGGIFGESKATTRIESPLGGLWNVKHFEGTFMGEPYRALEIIGFDPLEKRFVSAWVDSMNPLLSTMEGSYDAESKTLTMRGISVGLDGERAEMHNTTEYRDDGMLFTMRIEGQTLMTIDSTRKKK